MDARIKRVSQILASICALVGIISFGYSFIYPDRLIVGMAPSTGLLFIVCSLALLLSQKKISEVLALVVFFLSIFFLTQHYYELKSSETLDLLQVHNPLSQFILATAGLTVFLQRRRMLDLLCKSMTFLILFAAIFNILGYIYGFEEQSNVLIYVHTAPIAAVCFVLLAFAILFSREDKWMIDEVFGRRLGAVVARRYLFVILLLVCLGWLRLQGQNFGFYSVEFGLTIMAQIMIMTILVTTLWVASSVNKLGMLKDKSQRSAKLFRSLVDNANDGIFIIEAETGNILDVNNTVCERLGYSREEMTKMSVEDIERGIPGFSWRSHLEDMKRVGTMSLVGGHLRRDGRIVPVELSIKYLTGDEGDFVIAFARDVTERLEAESNIKKLQKRIESILGATKTGLDIIDSNFNVRYIDPEWKKVYGDPEGRKCYEYFMDRTSPCFGCGVIRALETKRPVVTEEYLLKEGNRPIQVTSIPFQDENGEWLVSEVNVDISVRKMIENLLRESEEMLRVMTESANDAIVMIDEMGLVSFWNCAAEAMFGYSAHEIMGKNCHYILAPKHYQSAYEKAFPAFKESGQGSVIGKTVELEASRKDGSIFPIELSIASLKLRGKWNAVGIVRDITTRKKAEQELETYHFELENMVEERTSQLKESENKYRQMLDSANDAVVLCDGESSKIIYANNAASRLFGRSIKELLTMHQPDLHPQEDEGSCRGKFIEAITHDKKVFQDVFIVNRTGKKIPVRISCSTFNLEGRKVGQAVFVDISDYKMLEQSLSKQLEDARRLSDIGVLAATVAHELRNPLGVISAAVYNIERKAKDPGLSKHIASIEKKIIESDRIIKNLLTYSRIKAPQLESVPLTLKLDECVNECQLRHKDIEVVFTKNYNCNEGDSIMADPLQMTELFSNLLDNACQSLVNKKGNIEITAGYDIGAGLARITIKDDGEGISEEELSKIMDPFFTNKARGVGLGLTVCGQVVSLHEGKINIKSKKGEGTIVTVELPIGKG